MKILVFDDNATHRAAAQAQLTGHDVTVVGTYDEAQKLLKPELDYKKAKAALEAQFGDFSPWRSADGDEVKKKAYFAAEEVENKKATTYPDFDVVLVDLLVPASRQAQGPDGYAHIGKEMPVGVFIGLLAAQNGAKYVAVFTDSSHHDHPAAACFDAFNRSEQTPTPFTVGTAKFLLSNTRNWVDEVNPDDLTKEVSWEDQKAGAPSVRAKNWKRLLDYLTEPETK